MRSWTVLLALGLFAAGGAQGQGTGRVTGRVVNDQGQPVASASVVVQGTRIGVVTGVDGRYLIPGVPAGGHTVVASLLGYGDATQAVTVVVGETVVANFRLAVKAVELSGVVAVGYGTQQRRTVTGAVSTVRAAQIAEMPTANAVKAIQGRVAGVDVVNQGNKPGDAMRIFIRGVRSITAAIDPLYVVDGVPIAGGIGDFNPADIVSIDVLKDAAATAVYGSRGANGVVLVTTRGAGTGGVQTQFTANASYATQSPTGLPTYMNNEQYATMLQAAAAYANQPTTLNTLLNSTQYAAYQNQLHTDWQSLIKRTGVQRNVQMGMNGISGNTRFSLSGNYFYQTGTTVGFNYNRVTGTASIDHTQGRLRLGVTGNYARSLQQTALGDALWGAARQQTGFGVPYDSSHTLITNPDGEALAYNPLKAVQGVVNDYRRDRVFASAFGTFRLADGIDLRVNFGPDYTQASHGNFTGAAAVFGGSSDRRAYYQQTSRFQYILDNMLQVNRDIGAIHHVDATLLYGIQRWREVYDSAGAQQIPYDAALYYSLSQGQNFAATSRLQQTALQSYMGRVVYTLLDRYTISGSLRRDGSSVLADTHKWTTFPTVGLSWQLGDEPFMKRFAFLSTLKLRGSYGKTGSSAINPYQTQGPLAYGKLNFGTTTANAYAPDVNNPANPNLTWEKTDQTDLALEYGIFNNRIQGSADWYKQNTTDLLLQRSLPATSGYRGALQNVGATRNTGVELQLSTLNVENWHGIRWQTDVSWAHNKNQVVSLNAYSDTTLCPLGARICDANNGWFVGQPINTGGQTNPLNSTGVFTGDPLRRAWFDYKMLGVWQLGQEAEAAKFGSKPGQIRVQDTNGDGKISTLDRVLMGNTYPKWTASIYNRVTFKSLDVSALANVRWGYTIWNTYLPSLFGRYGQIVANYWTPTNPTNENPSPNLGGATLSYGNSRGYIDGSHWRIRNIQVGYTLPPELVGRMRASTMRIYATATEPYIHYKYKYFDPESGWAGGSPVYRTLQLGVDVGF